MTTLTSIQDSLLRAAAEGEGAFAAARTWKTVAALVGRGLLTSAPLAEGGAHIAITEAGRLAIGLDAPETAEDDARTPVGTEPSYKDLPSALAVQATDSPSAPRGKIGVLVAMMRKADGATIEAMTQATGWQVHSVRGAISGSIKKTLNFTVSSEITDGVRVYRIVEAAA